jgi:hypothetical protein
MNKTMLCCEFSGKIPMEAVSGMRISQVKPKVSTSALDQEKKMRKKAYHNRSTSITSLLQIYLTTKASNLSISTGPSS